MAFPVKTAAKKGDTKNDTKKTGAKKGNEDMLEQLKKAAAEKGKK